MQWFLSVVNNPQYRDGYTVEPVLNMLKDRPFGHKNMISRQVIGSFTLKKTGDRFIYSEREELLPKTSGPSRQVVSHGSGL